MLIVGILGSPRLKGKCSKLLQEVLSGAESQGASTQRIDVIKYDIKHCMGCCQCMTTEPDLAIGKCPLKDDMAKLLELYTKADGYVLASPVYDVSITALMKKFLERKLPLFYRPREAYATISGPRRACDFKKKVVMIVTGNCGDEYRELMGDPCFEMLESQLILEQIETIEKLYVGGVENMTEETFKDRLNTAFCAGKTLVERIKAEGR